MIGQDVVVEDLAELVVGNARLWPVIGVGGRIADEHVDPAKRRARVVDEPLQPGLVGDVRRDRDRSAVAVAGVDLGRDRVARILLAAGDYDLRAMLGKVARGGQADSAIR